jgi:tRNA threonylcarbamoyladenosine biosynthesis protein TsaB
MSIILALETTEKYGSAALLDGKNILSEIRLPQDRRSSQTLAPAIDTLFQTTKILPKEVGVVSVVLGPGSFTGLRVGVTAAKVFAYAVGAKIIGFRTEEVIAADFVSQLTQSSSSKCSGCLPVTDFPQYLSVGTDAQRGEVAAVLYELRQDRTPDSWRFDVVADQFDTAVKTVNSLKLITVADWWKQTEIYENVLFSGAALERWHVKAPEKVRLSDKRFWSPKASVAGLLAAEKISNQSFSAETCFPDTCWSLQPLYSRLSAAEEKKR